MKTYTNKVLALSFATALAFSGAYMTSDPNAVNVRADDGVDGDIITNPFGEVFDGETGSEDLTFNDESSTVVETTTAAEATGSGETTTPTETTGSDVTTTVAETTQVATGSGETTQNATGSVQPTTKDSSNGSTTNAIQVTTNAIQVTTNANQKVSLGKTKIRTAKRAKNKKKVKLTLKKISNADGYEIQFSTSKKFATKKTKTIQVKSIKPTIKKLGATKKYYFKARAFKVVNAKYTYGVWSKVKKVK